MKKAAVVTASVILFVILIGINYLLWDNSSKKKDIESLVTKEETSQQSFQDLYDDYKAESEENQKLRTEINDLQKIIEEKENEIELIQIENLNRFNLVGDKNTIIYQLKKRADTDYFAGILDEWVKDINDKAYFAAYLVHNEKDIFNNRFDIPLGRYGEIFENVNTIEITDFKVRVMDSEDSLDQDAKNRIAFDVLFNIELEKDEDGFPVADAIFDNGINHFKVTMSFDTVKWDWFIWTIE